MQPHHCIADEHQLDMSFSSHHIVTDRKPPLMKKAKTRQRNIKSLFGEKAGNPSSSSSFGFNDTVPPEVPRSAETARRRLRLPWKKKKKRYMPGEELSRWRWNFESWMSASQSSLDANSESDSVADSVADRVVWRTSSQNELQNVDTVSVGWTDSDTDVMSDDPVGESFHDRGIYIRSFGVLVA